MLKHFILIRYKPDTPDSHISEFCRRMYALKLEIPEILELEIGRDMLHDERSWDLILIMALESVEALRRYQVHAEHQSVMHFNGPFVSEVASLDFENPVSSKVQ